MKNSHKALRVIAAIAGNYADNLGKPYSRVFAQIYRIAHSNDISSCSHQDWEDEFAKLHNELIDLLRQLKSTT